MKPTCTRRPQFSREEVQAIRHLTRFVQGYTWPETLKTHGGEDIALAEHKSGSRHFVRLMTFLPGKFLSQVKPHSPGLLRSLGVFLGSMDRGFATFRNPDAERMTTISSLAAV